MPEGCSMLENKLIEYGAVEVDAMTMYSDMFNLGEGYIQKKNEPSGEYKANPIGYYRNKNEKHGHYRIFFEDTFEETLKEIQEADFAILNGITYFGRKNEQSHASKMYAMIFDFDGVTELTLHRFLHGAFSKSEIYPMPNYVILSGHGLHLYYLFEEPIPLFPNIKMQLKELKYALTNRIWNRYTSTIESRQYQGINQGFRPVGAKTKIKGKRVRAFRLNTHPFSLQQLGRFVPNEYRVDEEKLFKESKISLEEAKKKYPKWYEDVVVNKMPKKTWVVKRDLYEWWKRQLISGQVSYGHRYFCIMCLAIYGVKCDIDFEEVKKDAYDLIDLFNDIKPDEPFSKEDVDSALECFDKRYCTFPRDDISKLSDISIKANKRNGRSRAEHIKLMNYIRDEINGNKNWRDGNGRKPKSLEVYNWRINNPDGTKAQCVRDTKITKPTVYKWWDYEPEPWEINEQTGAGKEFFFFFFDEEEK